MNCHICGGPRDAYQPEFSDTRYFGHQTSDCIKHLLKRIESLEKKATR